MAASANKGWGARGFVGLGAGRRVRRRRWRRRVDGDEKMVAARRSELGLREEEVFDGI